MRVLLIAISTLAGFGAWAPAAEAGDNPPSPGQALPDRIWVGSFSASTKEQVVAAFERSGAMLDARRSRVVQGDLNADGSEDYVALVLLRDGDGGNRRPGVGVLLADDSGFRFASYAFERGGPGIDGSFSFKLADFDGDGWSDFVDQRFEHVGGGEPEYLGIVFRYDGVSVDRVFQSRSWEKLELVDLNGDGTLELIDLTNEFNIDVTQALWPVVHQWQDTRWIEASENFPSFYAARAPVFRQTLEESRAKDEAYRQKTGKSSAFAVLLIQAMEEYLARVDRITVETLQP